MRPKGPEGTITVLLTDIEGSSRLWERFPEAMQSALARHDALLRAAIEAQGGHFVKTTGDGIHAVFDTALAGALAAAEGQVALLAEKWSDLEDETIRVRMGLHTGEAERRDGDYFGPTLNRAARLMALAAGGQILLSNLTASLVRERLPEGMSLLDLGEHRLKDLARPEHVHQIAAAGLPADFPPLLSLNVSPNNLPVRLTSFVGREREMAEAKRLLASTRLLTLIGPGGTGKSRLAAQVAADVLSDFAAGVWLVELAPLRDPNLIVQTIATTFGLREIPGVPLRESVSEYLRGKQLLLLLDNCEHLVEAVAELAEHLLHHAPQLKILASSREALGITGETVLRVPSLELPTKAVTTPAALAQIESVSLFVERAAAVRPGFSLTDENAATVAQICRRLDGIPLALELAAARIALFSPEQIAERLDDRFRLLTGGRRTALPRQQTLRALIDWSYDLLSREEQALFRRLSVFSGGWTFEAAEAVCDDLDTLDLLAQLVNKSLVIVDEQRAETRYRFLETIRQYGREKLMDAGESEEAQRRHLDYYASYAEAAAPKLIGPQAIEWVDRLEVEQDNLSAALEWAVEIDLLAALQLVGTSGAMWRYRASITEGYRRAKAVLERVEALANSEGNAVDVDSTDFLKAKAHALLAAAEYALGLGSNNENRAYAEASAAIARRIDDSRTLARALTMFSYGAGGLGELSAARAAIDEAVTISRVNGYRYELATALMSLAFLFYATGEMGDYRNVQEEHLRIARELGDPWMIAMNTLGAGRFATVMEDWEAARAHLEEAEQIFRRMRNRGFSTVVRSYLGHMVRKQGKPIEALAIYRKTIRSWQEIGQRAAVAHQLESLAFVARVLGETRRAAKLLGAAEALRESVGEPMSLVEKAEYESETEALRAQTDEAELADAWAEGRGLTMDEAVAYALEPYEAAQPIQ